MGLVQFLGSIVVPVLVSIYIFNFTRWLWKRDDRLAAVSSFALMVLSGGGSLLYFWLKLLD